MAAEKLLFNALARVRGITRDGDRLVLAGDAAAEVVLVERK